MRSTLRDRRRLVALRRRISGALGRAGWLSIGVGVWAASACVAIAFADCESVFSARPDVALHRFVLVYGASLVAVVVGHLLVDSRRALSSTILVVTEPFSRTGSDTSDRGISAASGAPR